MEESVNSSTYELPVIETKTITRQSMRDSPENKNIRTSPPSVKASLKSMSMIKEATLVESIKESVLQSITSS